MTGLPDLFRHASDEFGKRVAVVKDDQWHDPTPCTEWDVRRLVFHLVNEHLWVPPLVAEGKTIADVGDRFEDPDAVLGDDPAGAYERAAPPSVAAFAAPDAMERTVHLSFGDRSGREYAEQVFVDLVVHAWDLGKAIGTYEELEPELVEECWRIGKPMVDAFRSAGVFGDDLPVPEDADPQTRLLAVFGRRRDWMPPA